MINIIIGLCLTNKVFKKLNYQVHVDDIKDIISAKPGVIEAVLRQVQLVISRKKIREEEK